MPKRKRSEGVPLPSPMKSLPVRLSFAVPPVPRDDYRQCRQCNRYVDECGPLSHTRLCEECAITNVAHNLIGICEHSGPAFRRWRQAMAASVGGALLDDRPQQV